MDYVNAFQNPYESVQGMAAPRQVDMAPLNLPKNPIAQQQPTGTGSGIGGGIDEKIANLESLFANVHTNRSFTPQEMQDMAQKQQILTSLYKIRESSKGRELADEERQQKIDQLRMAGEEAKTKKQEAMRQKQTQIPGTYVAEQMGHNPYRPAGRGVFIDSQGRKAAVPMYGTVTPDMYGALGESVINGTAAPTAQDFQPDAKDNKFLKTKARMTEAIALKDYGKASALAQEQIGNLASIVAMPNLAPEAKTALMGQIEILGAQAKQNAGMAEEQIKAKSELAKQREDLAFKERQRGFNLDPKYQKLDQADRQMINKIYDSNYNAEIKTPVMDANGEWLKQDGINMVFQPLPLANLSAEQVAYLFPQHKGKTGVQLAEENFRAQLKANNLNYEPPSSPANPSNTDGKGTEADNAPVPSQLNPQQKAFKLLVGWQTGGYSKQKMKEVINRDREALTKLGVDLRVLEQAINLKTENEQISYLADIVGGKGNREITQGVVPIDGKILSLAKNKKYTPYKYQEDLPAPRG